MHYERIDSAVAACEVHINSLDTDSITVKEVESYLVSALVVIIVSEYEEQLENMFFQRAQKCGDSFVCNFVRTTMNQQFRSPDLSKINQMLKKFDDSYCDNFKSEIENSIHHAAWDSIMKARHAVVHKKGQLNMTFRELKSAYLQSKEIIRNLEVTLEINVEA